jgi:hypothetical protein
VLRLGNKAHVIIIGGNKYAKFMRKCRSDFCSQIYFSNQFKILYDNSIKETNYQSSKKIIIEKKTRKYFNIKIY